MAARGNRLVGVGRLGVALTAAVALVLVTARPAFSQEAPPPAPADTTTTSTEPAETTTAPPVEATTATPTETAPPAAGEPAGDSSTAPPADSADTSTATPEPSTAPDTASTPETAPKDAVKLEEEAPAESTPAPSAPAAPAPAPAPPAAAPPSGAPPPVTIVLVESPPAPQAPAAASPADDTAAPATVAETAAADDEIVSFRPPSPISLLPQDEQAAAAPARDAPAARAPKKLKRVMRTIVGQSCAQPRALVPLSQRCQQVRAVAALRVILNTAPGPEARATLERVTTPATVRQVEARAPPESKAAKKRPVAELRPTIPFGSSGQGATNDGFNGSSGSTWSSRVLALAAVPLRVPWPLRFAQLVLPSTIPHGVIAAPPTARPG